MSSLYPPIKKVLLVDDDEDDFAFFEEALKQVDPSIRVCHLSSAREVPSDNEFRLPDLLFLDINMPDKNGFEWLKEIRCRGYVFPVIMYSTASNSAYVQKAYQEGASLYFPKPESFNTLLAALKSLLNFDWQQPDKIKQNFVGNGEFRVFDYRA